MVNHERRRGAAAMLMMAPLLVALGGCISVQYPFVAGGLIGDGGVQAPGGTEVAFPKTGLRVIVMKNPIMVSGGGDAQLSVQGTLDLVLVNEGSCTLHFDPNALALNLCSGRPYGPPTEAAAVFARGSKPDNLPQAEWFLVPGDKRQVHFVAVPAFLGDVLFRYRAGDKPVLNSVTVCRSDGSGPPPLPPNGPGNREGYRALLEQVARSVTDLRAVGAKVPLEYVRGRLGKPDFTVPPADLWRSDALGGSLLEYCMDKELRDKYWPVKRGGPIDVALEKTFEGCLVILYDEGARFGRPPGRSGHYRISWFAVAPDGTIVGNDCCLRWESPKMPAQHNSAQWRKDLSFERMRLD